MINKLIVGDKLNIEHGRKNLIFIVESIKKSWIEMHQIGNKKKRIRIRKE